MSSWVNIIECKIEGRKFYLKHSACLISNYAKNSIIIASHMDTVSHLTVTREDIKALKLNNIVVPDDNEIFEFNN